MITKLKLLSIEGKPSATTPQVGDVLVCDQLELVPGPTPEIGWTETPALPIGGMEYFCDTSNLLLAAMANSKPGDHIVIDRGVSYEVSGLSLKDGQVLRSTDDYNNPPPILKGSTDIIKQIKTPVNNVQVRNIEFQGPDDIFLPRGSGVSLLEANDWYFEGCIFKRFGVNINITGNNRKKNIKLHRCVSLDSVQVRQSETGEWGWLHSHGLFAKNTDGLTLSECIFDGNGWRPDIGERWGQNHNCYIQGELGNECSDVHVLNCLSTNSANLGFMCRVATEVCGNFSAFNPTGISAGTEKESRLQPCFFTDNVSVHGVNVIGSSNVPTLCWTFLIGDVENPEILDNLAWSALGVNGYGMMLRNRVGSYRLENNTLFNHGDAYRQKLTEYTSNYYGYNNFNPTSGKDAVTNLSGPQPYNWASDLVAKPDYTLADYDPKFVEELRAQRRGDWRTKYTAQAVNEAFKEAAQ